MKRETKSNGKKERAIMIISSAFVLTALTVTGVYLRSENVKTKDDGYTVDFSTMEKEKQNTYEGIRDTNLASLNEEIEDDLDYMPLEVGGNDIVLAETAKLKEDVSYHPEEEVEEEVELEEVFVDTTIHFPGAGQLLRPVEGDVLIPYSMDKGVYFTTLDQYKYNPAEIYRATEGTIVAVCADGVVEDISFDPVTGNTVLLDLGDGYKAIYGQVDELSYTVGDFAAKGTVLGKVAKPTKYFVKEGTNLYFELQNNGQSVNPAEYLMQ